MPTHTLTWSQQNYTQSSKVLQILEHPGVWRLQTRQFDYSFFQMRAPRCCKFCEKSTLGFGGYRHGHLIPVFYNWEPIGSANSRKELPWGLVVTDMLTWYHYLLGESPQVLQILGKRHLGVWWLQTRSLDTNILWLRAHRFCLFWEKNIPGFGDYRNAHLKPISFN